MEKQTFINEMTCHFNLREPKSQRPTNIYCIICIDGKQMKFPTGVKIYQNPIDQEHNTITIIQKKTNTKAVIPILPIARELIEKYKEKELKYYNEKSRNTPNKTIKLLLKLIGCFDEEITYQENGKTITEPLYKLVHTHTARHTFITIMCRKGVPKDTVILATGHENTKMIDEVYTHLTQKDKAKKVSEALEFPLLHHIQILYG